MVTSLLLILPVPFRVQNQQIMFEEQACNGLQMWADNFDSLIVAAPVMPEFLAEQNKTIVWKDTSNLPILSRCELITLPWAYSLPEFLKYYSEVRKKLALLISRCNYLQFALGAFVGDWAAVAALEAIKQKRPYAIHTDRVEHEVILEESIGQNLLKRIKTKYISFLMARYHRFIISNSTLGLWHGYDCYQAYSTFCHNSYLVHNIHTKITDNIKEVELNEKIKEVYVDNILRICYVGRAEAMKAPLDWIKAIAQARKLGLQLEAEWIGEGSLLSKMQSLIHTLELENCVNLTGFEKNRDNLLAKIKKSHLMLNTHITPESPRCLIESLICGTPIVGYESGYAKDLVKNYGGGEFVKTGNYVELGELLAKIGKNRDHLALLIKQAAQSGLRFNDKTVFKERSDLIKKYL